MGTSPAESILYFITDHMSVLNLNPDFVKICVEANCDPVKMADFILFSNDGCMPPKMQRKYAKYLETIESNSIDRKSDPSSDSE